jgi:hypothetical protein
VPRRIGAPDYGGQMVERRILDLIDAKDGIERAAVALMREFHAIDVVRNSTRLLSNGKHLIFRNVDEFRVGVDKAPDQPGAGDTVDLRMFSRYPFSRGSPDVSPRGHSPLGPIGNAAFQEVRLHSHEAQGGGHPLADLMAVNAVRDDLAAARQFGSPLFHAIGRAMKGISHEPVGAGKVGIAPHVDNDRRRFGA